MKRICPVCDGRLNAANYCSRCRKVVKKPLTINSEMYLNERHSANEKDCEFHREPEPTSHTQPENPAPPVQTSRQTVTVSNMLKEFEPGAGKKSVAMMGIVIAVPVIISLVIFFLSIGVRVIERNVQSDEIWDVSEEAYTGHSLSYEEVMEAGTACSAYLHFSLSVNDLIPQMEQWLSDYGYQWEAPVQEMDNTEYTDVTPPITIFETYRSYQPTRENAGNYYVALHSDTATGQVHSIVLLLEEEEIRGILENFCRLAENAEGIPDEDSHAPALAKQFQLDENGQFQYEGEDFTIYADKEENLYYLYIGR